MTKEELEKEAEEWLSKNWTSYDFYDTECNVYNDDIKQDLIEGYIAGTEPREKRIADLERKLEQTEKDLTDYQFNYPKIKELEEANGKLLQRITQLEKDVTENESDCSMCDFPKLKQDLEKQLEQAKKYLEECVYNVVSPERLRNDIAQFLKEIEK